MDFLSGAIAQFGYNLIDKGAIPDWILRPAIRFLCRVRLSSLPLPEPSYTSHAYYKSTFVSSLQKFPTITAPESTSKANEQHYEVSTAFVLSCLGPRAKYSACLWERDGPCGGKVKTLAEAEEAVMELYCVRAGLSDGMDVLDLGCGKFSEINILSWHHITCCPAFLGWGSLSLYLAEVRHTVPSPCRP